MPPPALSRRVPPAGLFDTGSSHSSSKLVPGLDGVDPLLFGGGSGRMGTFLSLAFISIIHSSQFTDSLVHAQNDSFTQSSHTLLSSKFLQIGTPFWASNLATVDLVRVRNHHHRVPCNET